MDLIYMNENREDVGVLLKYDLDLSFGANENDFTCTVNKRAHCCKAGYYLYMDGTEYGGVIDAVESDTATGDVTYSGRTWHGLLESKILEPDAGTDYLILSGEANAVIDALLTRIGLDSLFTASPAQSGIAVKNYKMNRYIGAYSGIVKMLKDLNAKLLFTFENGHVVLSAAPVVDHTQTGLDSDVIDFVSRKTKAKINHLICLGQGELAERQVVHLYADTEGNVSQTQSLFGLDEYTETYDYSFAEDLEDLIENGTEKLKEMQQQDKLSVSFNSTEKAFDIGDIVGAYDNETGLSVSVEIKQKIVTIKDGVTAVSYSTDTEGTSSTGGTSSSGESGGGGSSAELTDHINNKNNPHEVKAAQVEGLLDLIHPVGSVYTSTVATNPETLFGGTWERIKDTFLWCAGDSDAAGTTGGEKTHILTQAELPTIQGQITGGSGTSSNGYGIFREASGVFRETDMAGNENKGTTYAPDHQDKTPWVNGINAYQGIKLSIGSDEPHNNMPPYLVVYAWKRTA